LEHEDDEYEAEAEDILYIFKSCIEIVLSRDPIQLLKVDDVRDLVTAQTSAVPSPELYREFELAPHPRQREIVEFLANTALETDNADLVRQTGTSAKLIPRSRVMNHPGGFRPPGRQAAVYLGATCGG
jgi:hypothetical protein